MAVVALLSAAITNRDASPRVANDSILEGGMVRQAGGFMETALNDSVGSTYRFCQVPSNAKILSVLLWADAAGSAGDMDLGIYQTTDNGGAVVDADHFASAVDVNAAALAGVDVTHESGVFGVEDSDKALWKALGLSVDSRRMYDVVGTLTEAIATTAQTLAVKVLYAI